MLYNLKEAVITVNGVNMDYITFGKGTKPLVMIQGLNTKGIKGSGVMLSVMYRKFSKAYRVYLFDRRDNAEEGITVQQMAEDTAAAMDALELSAADIIGVSQGGMIAQYLAIERPDLVNKLVLAVTLSKNNSTVCSVIDKWTDMAEKGQFKALVTHMAENMYSAEYVKRYRLFMPLLAMVQKPKDVQRFIVLAKACLTCTSYDLLDKIKCPVFVIGGAEDKIVTAEASLEIAQKLGCKCHIYPQLGHAAYEEAKDFNSIVYNFLKEE